MISRENLNYLDPVTGNTISRLTINFTGQRPKDLYKYNKNDYTFVIIFIQELIRRFYDNTKMFDEIVCIHGGAQGIDQLSFWACYNLKNAGFPIINKIYVPFSEFPDDRTAIQYLDRDISAAEYKALTFQVTGQEQKWIDGDIFTKGEYQLMLSLADYIRILDVKMGYETIAGFGRMLNRRNQEMVLDSDLTIGIVGSKFDYKTATKSGTRNCLRDAIDNGNEVMMFHLPEIPFRINDIHNIDIVTLMRYIKISKWLRSTGWIPIQWKNFIEILN